MSRAERVSPSWALKVVLGLALMAQTFVAVSAPALMPTLFRIPYPLFLALVLAGGGTALLHSAWLKHAGDALVTGQGLYRFVRHPMYLGDAFVYAGFALYPATVPGMVAYGIALIALMRLSDGEDSALAARHGGSHAQWRSRTGRLVPHLRRPPRGDPPRSPL